jgi:hypothetical protein
MTPYERAPQSLVTFADGSTLIVVGSRNEIEHMRVNAAHGLVPLLPCSGERIRLVSTASIVKAGRKLTPLRRSKIDPSC